jgi:two-component system response regulator DegU
MTLKVLIVDDNAEVRRMIRRFISDLAAEIREADDGANALDAYAAFRPDWVLMDIEMKHTNGIAATARIRAVYPQAKVVILTNYNDDQLRARATEAGACAYVLKENLFDLRELLTADALDIPAENQRSSKENG